MKKVFLIFCLLMSVNNLFSQETLEDKRNKYIQILNEGFKKFKGEDNKITRIARTKEDDLKIYITYPIPYKKNEFGSYGLRAMKSLSYVTGHLILDTEFTKKFILDELKYHIIYFIVELEYTDTTYEKEFYTTSRELRKLNIPFRKSEFIRNLF